MKSETLKTILGLIVIGVIVIATFLYGNSQRQSNLRAQDDAKHQQTAQVSPPATAVAPKPGGVSTTTHNTAPVTSPTANVIQGGSTVATTGGTATPLPGAHPTVSTTPIPDTGSSTLSLLGVSLMLVAIAYWRTSRRVLTAALRAPRNL